MIKQSSVNQSIVSNPIHRKNKIKTLNKTPKTPTNDPLNPNQ
jgi:hypothetical protein